MGPGPVVQHVGGPDGSWLFLFLFSRVRLLLSFLTSGCGPDYDRQGRSGAMETVICKTATADSFGSGGAAAMALRAARSGTQIQDSTHTPCTATAEIHPLHIYRRMLHKCLLPILRQIDVTLGDPVFQQDTARIHTSNIMQQFFTPNNIDVADHPPYSPDLNPIENAWALLKRQVTEAYPGLADTPGGVDK